MLNVKSKILFCSGVLQHTVLCLKIQAEPDLGAESETLVVGAGGGGL